MYSVATPAVTFAVDWWDWPAAGTWPEWFAVIVTAAAAWIALREYRRNGQTRREAQARLVYARSDRVRFCATDEPLFVQHVDAGSVFETNDRHGNVQFVASEPVVAVVASVRNLSQELTGTVRVEVVLDSEVVAGLVFVCPEGIEPQSELTASIVVPNPLAPDEPSVGLRVTFCDAAGRWWVRSGSSPVREVPEP